MLIIAIVNSKGGVGKTTLTASLAVRAAQDSDRVAAVDLDPQRSLVHWWKRRGRTDHPAVLEGVDSAEEAIERLELTGWDYVFLDGPPAFLTTIQSMISVAHFVLIPVKPSIVDMLATQDAVVLARKANAAFLCCLSDVGSGDKKVAQAARSSLFNAGVPLAQTEMIHRVSHIQGMTVGKSASEVNGGKDEQASKEIDALWTEVKSAALSAKSIARKAVNV